MNKELFFSSIRVNLFGGKLTQGVVDTIEEIFKALDKYQVTDLRQRAYVFATAFHESYSANNNPQWLPVREGWGLSDQSAINAVTALFKAKKISVNYALAKANGKSYFGRGFAQITHDFNYKTMGKRLGILLYDNPDLALNRKYAAEIMVVGMKEGLFTGAKLSTYINSIKADYLNARKIINGIDQQVRIARFADQFYNALILK